MMNQTQLRQLISQPEDERLELKLRLFGRRATARSLSALANTRGGYLMVGVEAGRGLIGTLHAKSDVQDLKRAALLVTPAVDVEIARYELNGKELVLAEIAESLEKPHFVEGIALERQGSRLTPISATSIVRVAGSNRLGVVVEQLNRRLIESRAGRWRGVVIGGLQPFTLTPTLSRQGRGSRLICCGNGCLH
jgi:predicted HTH transcriptional regulator